MIDRLDRFAPLVIIAAPIVGYLASPVAVALIGMTLVAVGAAISRGGSRYAGLPLAGYGGILWLGGLLVALLFS